jgi:4-hydroxy-tetrahydrodipicolinate synthase
MIIEGILPAIITPMDDDEQLNLQEFAVQIQRQLNAGVNGIFCLGTNGEFYSLGYQEKLQVITKSCEVVNKQVPVIAGVGCITTRESIQLAQEAEKIGVDAVSVITPYFIKCSQDDLLKHYTAVAKAVKVPVFLYAIPARTGNDIDPETLEKLEKIDNIAAIKDSSGNFEKVKKYIEISKHSDNFTVFLGTDSLILDGLINGAVGSLSGLANVAPELICNIYKSYKNNDLEAAKHYQEQTIELRKILQLGNPNSMTKRAVRLLGFPVGPCREPANIADAEIDEKIRRILSGLQLM